MGGPTAPPVAPISSTLGGPGSTVTATTTTASVVPEVHGRPLGDITRRVFGHIVDSIVMGIFALPAIVAMIASIDWEAIFDGRTTEPDIEMPLGLIAVSWVLSALYLVLPIAFRLAE